MTALTIERKRASNDPLALALDSAALNLAHLRRNIDGAREGTDPEHLHEMRVALRRLRAAAGIAAKAGARILSDGVAQDVKWLSQALGAARDWDVFVSDTWQAVRSQLRARSPTVESIDAVLMARRNASQRRLRRTLASRRFEKLVRTLDAAIENAAETAAASTRRREARRFARRVLAKRARRVLDHGRDIHRLPPEARHALRIDTKKLRYGAELVAALYQGRAPRAYLRRLTGLQTALGGLNDLATGQSMVDVITREVPPTDRTVLRDLWRRYVDTNADRLEERLATTWKRFLRTEPFW